MSFIVDAIVKIIGTFFYFITPDINKAQRNHTLGSAFLPCLHVLDLRLLAVAAGTRQLTRWDGGR